MNNRFAITTLSLLALAAAASAAGTFATYTNLTGGIKFVGAPGSSPNSVSIAPITLDGLELGSSTYDGVTVQLDAVDFTDSTTLGGGLLTFKQGSNLLLSAKFDRAHVSTTSIGGTLYFSGISAMDGDGDNVVFGGLATATGVKDNGISFALSNTFGSQTRYNSSFFATGNVEAVPEPATMTALGLGTVALLRKRRRA